MRCGLSGPSFALYATEVFIAERGQVIDRQREEMLELSTPVVELWSKALTVLFHEEMCGSAVQSARTAARMKVGITPRRI